MVHRLTRASGSIRTRFLAVVALGAILPLALIGVWLTRAAARAGEGLLQAQLDQSIQRMTDALARRWSFRSGDLELLVHNEVARRLLTPAAPAPLAAADSAWLLQVASTMSQTFSAFEYRDRNGVARWTTPTQAPDTTDSRGQQRATKSGPALTIVRQISVSGDSAAIGTLTARVNIATLIATDTSYGLPNGARLQVVQRDPNTDVLPAFAPDSLLARGRFTLGGIDWLAVHRTLAEPAIDLQLAAPLTSYVGPFQRAARTGNMVLAIVSIAVLLIAVFLITRLTRSLGQLALAADAVAAGDLERRVENNGHDEVGRVSAAFNAMIDNLRRTLDELSKRQALAAVGEYAAALSHEVRNGLTAVRVDLQRAEEKTPADAPGRDLINRRSTT